jgi:hypothetical protein
MKAVLGNNAARNLDELEAIGRTRLRIIHRRPDLINALRGQTSLTFDPAAIDPGLSTPPARQTMFHLCCRFDHSSNSETHGAPATPI